MTAAVPYLIVGVGILTGLAGALIADRELRRARAAQARIDAHDAAVKRRKDREGS